MLELGRTLPHEVRRTMEDLYERTEVMPVVTRDGMTAITLEHTNERVRMTQRYVRPVGSKRWRWHSSHLWVNGVERPIANSMNHYVAIFLDTEDEFLGRKKIELPPLEALPPGDEVPLGVRGTLQKIEKAMERGRSKTHPMTGMEGERYVIQVTGPLATVRLYFEAHHQGSGTGRCYRQDQKDPLRVVRADGTDMTQEVLDSPELYAALMAGDMSAVNTEAPRTPATNTQGSRSNAVETRRATVRRV